MMSSSMSARLPILAQSWKRAACSESTGSILAVSFARRRLQEGPSHDDALLVGEREVLPAAQGRRRRAEARPSPRRH